MYDMMRIKNNCRLQSIVLGFTVIISFVFLSMIRLKPPL